MSSAPFGVGSDDIMTKHRNTHPTFQGPKRHGKLFGGGLREDEDA